MARNKFTDGDDLGSQVRDNGRRGEPIPGCDCVRCFGYCMVDREQAFRLQNSLEAWANPCDNITNE